MTALHPANFTGHCRKRKKLHERAPPPAMTADRRQRRRGSVVTTRSPSSSSSSSSPSSAPAGGSDSGLLHFFVRAASGTLTIRASPDETVFSLIRRMEHLTGACFTDHRLLTGIRQLDDDLPLAACRIDRDATLHLVGRMRSAANPLMWEIAGDIVTVCSGLRSKRVFLAELVRKFFKAAESSSPVDPRTNIDVFTASGATAALVRLYLSPCPLNRIAAANAIQTSFESPKQQTHGNRVLVLMEVCKMLSTTVGSAEVFYMSCRKVLAASVAKKDNLSYLSLVRPEGLVSELLAFLSEAARAVINGLPQGSVDIKEFSNFLRAFRRAFLTHCLNGEKVLLAVDDSAHQVFEGLTGPLYGIFNELLCGCIPGLEKAGSLLKVEGQADMKSLVSDYHLGILYELHTFTKIFQGAHEKLYGLLLSQHSVVNILVKYAKSNPKHRWLLGYKNVADFEATRRLVLMLFPYALDPDYDDMHEMLIDRSQLLAESFEYILVADKKSLCAGIFMEFKNEEATGPGVLREWFCLVCREIFSPQRVLFQACPNNRKRFFPNPTSSTDGLHLKYFVFCGRIIALALMHKIQVDVAFDRVFLLQLAGKNVTLEDVQDADPCFYMCCKKILEMDAKLLDSDALGLAFVREYNELGIQKTIELLPGGRDIPVNSKNRKKYVELLIKNQFVISTSKQVTHFAQGFGGILDKAKYLKVFFGSLDPDKFDLMLGGSQSNINVTEWKSHTEYNGYKDRDLQINWFWKVVRGMTEEQKKALLFFWTSVRVLPFDGFDGLASKLYIYKSALPKLACRRRTPASTAFASRLTRRCR